MMDSDTFSLLFGLLVGIWLLTRISRLAERSRMQQAREELIREVVRERVRQKKLDELYGRNGD
tara:strand:- start:619 stop:807 length:189 start_codon:yes stop_codon:yes gene_type:complete